MSHPKLSVNVNRVALLRNSRDIGLPNLLELSRIALEAGAAGLTVHPRPDQRHIRPDDVDDISDLLNEFAGREFNIEGNPFIGDYLDHCRRTRPTQATFVPDSPEQRTSDHGFVLDDAVIARLQPLIRELKDLGIRVSLFMDADPAMIERVPATGADRVELYTESYARAYDHGGEMLEREFRRFQSAAAKASEMGLGLNAGHDLNLDNLPRFISIPDLLEVSIGHALIADALKMGMRDAVKAYLHVVA
ncbi:MAG: pyridoxine 5'-phosphate synthase [Phycisphaeraceae bacterium]|nr:pyridoxine 5'-phosphate synthase [Phycisphaeraceae bacterium]